MPRTEALSASDARLAARQSAEKFRKAATMHTIAYECGKPIRIANAMISPFVEKCSRLTRFIRQD